MDIIFRWYFEMNFQSTEAKAASSEVFCQIDWIEYQFIELINVYCYKRQLHIFYLIYYKTANINALGFTAS